MTSDNERRVAQLSEAMEKANDAFRTKIEELSLVSRIGEAVSRHNTLGELSLELVELIAETTLCRYVALYSANPEHFLNIEAVSALFGRTHGFPASIPAENLRRVSENPNEATYIECLDAWRGGGEWPLPRDTQSWLIIPLTSRDTTRGVLILTDDQAGAFHASTLRTLQMVIPQIAGALSNIQLYENLRTSEAKYRSFVERMQDVVYICDRQWKIIDMNPAAQELFPQVDAGESLPKLFSSDHAASQFRGTIEIFRSIQNFECALSSPSQDEVSALINAVDDGERISVVIRDVTEQKRLAEQLGRSQKMESIGTLASGIAHDFNNIIGIILPTAELIQLTEGEGTNSERAATIIEASTRASDLTGRLLSLARDEPHSSERVDLNEVVAQTARLLRETIDRTIRLKILPGAVPPIRADEGQLTQVLINLAINARDEMPAGGQITFRTSAEAGRVLLSVADDGPGIDRAVLDKIFDPFFTTKDKGRGTGLGLSMVYGTVQRHGGTIEVRTELNRGTEFLMYFPSTDGSVRKPENEDRASNGGEETILLLLVDDEQQMLSLMAAALSNQGYPVQTASNGAEALDRITPEVDLVILDMIMRVMDGLSTLRRIRERFPETKVLVASGYTAPDRLAALEVLGLQGFLPKPFPVEKLNRAVRDVLDDIAA